MDGCHKMACFIELCTLSTKVGRIYSKAANVRSLHVLLGFYSHVITKPFNFIQTKIHVFLGNLWRQDNHAEKVDFVF